MQRPVSRWGGKRQGVPDLVRDWQAGMGEGWSLEGGAGRGEWHPVTSDELTQICTEQLKLTQVQLADLIGKSRRTIQEWETGRTPIGKITALLTKAQLT